MLSEFLHKLFKLPEKPFALTSLGWHKYDKKMLQNYPIRQKIVNFVENIEISISAYYRKYVEDYYWMIKRRLFDRYDIVKAETLSPYEYYDKDKQMLHINFSLLVDYVEKEKCFEVIDYDHESQKEIGDEIKFLYKWWTQIRPNRLEHEYYSIDFHEFVGSNEFKDDGLSFFTFSEKYPDNPKVKEFRKIMEDSSRLEDTYLKEDDDMLIRLMKIRHFLWT